MSLTEQELYIKQKALPDDGLILLKFTASWCGPCQGIRTLCEDYVKRLPSTVFYLEIDIDESIELYMKFKKMKMLNGIPAIFAFYPGDKEHWFVPDDSVLGGDKIKVKEFFDRCINKVVLSSSSTKP